jgi:hypothetical protein
MDCGFDEVKISFEEEPGPEALKGKGLEYEQVIESGYRAGKKYLHGLRIKNE